MIVGDAVHDNHVGVFLCVFDNDGNTLDNCQNAARHVTKNVAVSTNPLKLTLLQGSGKEINPVTMKHLSIGKDDVLDGLSSTDFASEIEAIARRLVGELTLVPVVPLLDDKADPLRITEDVEQKVDLRSLVVDTTDIEFIIDALALGGTVDPAARDNQTFDGEFSFLPDANFSGSIDLNFDYGFFVDDLYVCSRPNNPETIEVQPVHDRSRAATIQPRQVFAGVADPVTLLVANDVDFKDNLLNDGEFIVTSVERGEVFQFDCVTPLERDRTGVQNGEASFCFVPDSTLLAGEQTSLEFTVEDSDGLAGTGSILYLGGNPVDFPDDIPKIPGTEDQSLVFNFIDPNGPVFAVNNVDDGEFEIRVLDLVDENLGELRFNGVRVAVNQFFNQDDELNFVPEPDIFNANNVGGARDQDGKLIGDCDDNDRINGFCPITFRYQVFKNGANSEPGLAQIVLSAADDFGPVLVVENEDILVDEPDADDGKLSGVTITSDNGNDVFRVTLELRALDGLSFELRRDDNTEDNVGKFNENDNCDGGFCHQVYLFGAPVLLTRIVRDMRINVPVNPGEGQDPRLMLRVRAGSQQTGFETVRFEVVQSEQAFFDDPVHIAIVGCCGGLVVTLLLILTIFRKARAAKISEENILFVAETAVRLEKQAKRGVKDAFYDDDDVDDTSIRSNKRALRIDADDDIFDWEKHIDKESGDVYFFNPKTGESDWDPPTVKNYHI